MTREIKFRAWDTSRKQMFSPEEMGRDELTLNPDGRGFVNTNSMSTRLSAYYSHIIPLQYTGLKDNKGIPIYEGDILGGIPGHLPFEVKWNDANGYWWGTTARGGSDWVVDLAPEHEVIGNIYENGDLLNGQQ